MSRNRGSIKKYAIVGAIVVAAIVGILAAFALAQQPQQSALRDTDQAGSQAEPGAPDESADINEAPIPQESFPQGISVTPNPYSEEDELTVEGNGFSANQEITISLNNTRLQTAPETVISDSAGAFTAVIAMPEVEQGDHNISASDESGTAVTTTVTKR